MSIIIHGASGAQGGPLFNSMSAKRTDVLAAVRDPAKIGGESSVFVDNGSIESMIAAYDGADAVFFHLPNTSEGDRLGYAANFLEAIRVAAPRRVVFSTSGAIIDRPTSSIQVPDDNAVAVIVRGLKTSGTSHAVVAPRLYLENLLSPTVINRVREAGVILYPLRADFPVSWSSHLDVAEVVERLLMDDAVEGVVGVGQVPGIAGTELADAFSAHFGRPVTFEAQTPDDLRRSLEPYIGPAAANVAAFYQTLSTRVTRTSP